MVAQLADDGIVGVGHAGRRRRCPEGDRVCMRRRAVACAQLRRPLRDSLSSIAHAPSFSTCSRLASYLLNAGKGRSFQGRTIFFRGLRRMRRHGTRRRFPWRFVRFLIGLPACSLVSEYADCGVIGFIGIATPFRCDARARSTVAAACGDSPELQRARNARVTRCATMGAFESQCAPRPQSTCAVSRDEDGCR